MAPRSLLLAAFAALLAALLAVPAAAQDPVRAGRLHVIGPARERETVPEFFRITPTETGFLAAWWNSGDSHEEFMRVRALDARGEPRGPVHVFPATSLAGMQLAASAGGAWLLYTASSERAAYLQRLSPAGEPIGGRVRIDEGAVGPELLPQPDGGVLVAFLGVDLASRPVGAFVRRVGPDGAIGPRIQISDAGRAPGRAELAPVAGGAGALVVWNERTADGRSVEIFTRRLGADGVPVTAPLQLSWTERSIRAPDPEAPTVLGATLPTLVHEPALDQYLVVWVTADASVGGAQIVGRRLDAAGAPLDAEPFAIAPRRPPTGGSIHRPAVVSDASTGAWVVTWSASWWDGISGGYNDVVAHRLPHTAPASAAPGVRVDDPYAGVGVPAVAAGPHGAVVGWLPVAQQGRGPVTRRLGAGPDPGAASVTGAPTGDSASRDAAPAIASSRPGATLECRVDAHDWHPCATPWTLRDLADGVRRVAVRSVGPEGWVELGDGAQASWRVEAAPPKTTITVVPNPDDPGELVRFTADEPATFECRWDGGEWHRCFSIDGPSRRPGDGKHRIEVRATDAVGRRESIPARYDWPVADAAPPRARPATSGGAVIPTPEVHEWFAEPVTPAVRITTRLYSTNATSAAIEFTQDPAGAAAECRLDYGEWRPCTSPARFDGLAEGFHRVQVRASDENVGDEWQWRVDLTPPDTRIVGDPLADGSRTGRTSVGLKLESRDPGLGRTERFYPEARALVDCRIDGGPWRDCRDGAGFSGLADGAHLVEAYAIDAAGNADPTPATFRFIVDTTVPDTTIAAGPVTGPDRAAEFALRADAVSDGFECRLDAAAWDACEATVRVTGLADGPHRFEARAVRYSRVDATPAVWQWTVGATVTPTPTPTATLTVSPDPTVTPQPTVWPEPTVGPSPTPFVAPRPPDDTTGRIAPPAKAAPVRAWARAVAVAARKAGPSRSARVRLSSPAAGRLVVRVLDRRGRTLSRGVAAYPRAATRTLTLKPVRRGARATVSVRWTPAIGRAQTVKRRF